MARFTTAAAFAFAGLSLSGCLPVDESLRPHFNPTITSVNQPVVQRTDYVFDLAGGAGGVSTSELQRLDAWFYSLDLGYGDRVSIDDGSYGNGYARQGIASVAESYGLLLSDGAPVTAGRVPAGSVRVIVSRTTASVPGCPQWDANEIGARTTTSPNYGCATNSNLAAMIANPSDLVVGQAGDTSVDAATASKAIDTYRKKPPTGTAALKQEATSSGAGQ